MESNPLTVVFHMVGIRHERVEVNSKDTKTMTIKAIRLFSKSYLRPCQISKTDFFCEKAPSQMSNRVLCKPLLVTVDFEIVFFHCVYRSNFPLLPLIE